MPPFSMNPSGMSSLSEFHYFIKLPPELRLEIWEYHFRALLSPRVHRITAVVSYDRDVLPTRLNFPVDNISDHRIRPIDRNITQESQTAARWVEQARGTPEPISKDVAQNVQIWQKFYRNRTPFTEMILDLLDKYLATVHMSTRIDWAVDLLYLKLPSVSHPFHFLVNKQNPSPWVAKVQRLAIYLNKRSIVRFSQSIDPDNFKVDEWAILFKSIHEITLVLDQPLTSTITINPVKTIDPDSTDDIGSGRTLRCHDTTVDGTTVRGPDHYGLIYLTLTAVYHIFKHANNAFHFLRVCTYFVEWRRALRACGQTLNVRFAVMDTALKGEDS